MEPNSSQKGATLSDRSARQEFGLTQEEIIAAIRAGKLHDSSQTPHLRLYCIDEAFSIAQSTGAAKLKDIRMMFRIRQLDPKWTLPSKMADNPMVWMLEVSGFIMDVRHAPREIQEVAFEKGLIPYIPADRAETDEES